jgi:hypothetical protein
LANRKFLHLAEFFEPCEELRGLHLLRFLRGLDKRADIVPGIGHIDGCRDSLGHALLEVGFCLEGIGAIISTGHLIPSIHQRVVHALGDLVPCHLPVPIEISLGLEESGDRDVRESFHVVVMLDDGDRVLYLFTQAVYGLELRSEPLLAIVR